MSSPPSETLFEELKRYVRFTSEDARLLASFHDVAAPHFERISIEFYDRIREHEAAHDVFTGEDQIVRLQRSLVRWMHRLFGGVYDERYFAETAKIGRIHTRVGLPQRYMFTAMALIRVSLTRIADEALGATCRPTREAITRVLDLELAVMVETYRESYIGRLEQLGQMEKQALNRALARSEHRYVNAIGLAHVLIVGTDRHGAIRLFNREAERVTGFAEDEVFAQRADEILFADEVRSEHAELLRMRLTGDVRGAEVFTSALRTRAGKIRDVRWQLAYAPSEEGDVDDIVLFAVGQDITDERAMEERTRQAEKLAAVGTLAAGLAHEIRNPLNGAQLHVAFLERAIKKKDGDADMLEATHVVGEEIKRLATLVSEFLDFARPRPLDVKPVSLHKLCTRAHDLVVAKAKAAHATLIVDLPVSDLELLVDGAKIEQVLLNLLQNAVEALAPTGGGTVKLRARRQPRNIVIDVEDDGPGLPSPSAPIFDAFYSTKPDGTGLGLAITHRIVTDHSGTIEVDSVPGKTTFKISLPLAPSPGLRNERIN